jgi:hypothetical protein
MKVVRVRSTARLVFRECEGASEGGLRVSCPGDDSVIIALTRRTELIQNTTPTLRLCVEPMQVHSTYHLSSAELHCIHVANTSVLRKSHPDHSPCKLPVADLAQSPKVLF